MHRALASIALALSLSACVGGSYVRDPQPASAPPPTSGSGFRTPQVMRGGDVGDLIGAQAATLTRRFGEARIDMSEGDARKLQFASDQCVLDIFLYPMESGGTPVATHVEARLKQGGGAVDRSRCIADVERSARRR